MCTGCIIATLWSCSVLDKNCSAMIVQNTCSPQIWFSFGHPTIACPKRQVDGSQAKALMLWMLWLLLPYMLQRYILETLIFVTLSSPLTFFFFSEHKMGAFSVQNIGYPFTQDNQNMHGTTWNNAKVVQQTNKICSLKLPF